MRKNKSAETTVEEYLVKEILNGKIEANTMLKPERELAEALGYSRPVIHKAIIRLEARGLLTIIPRRGVRVNDFRQSGKLGILEIIYDMYHTGISRKLNVSMLVFIQNNLEAILETICSGDLGRRLECCSVQAECSYETGEDVFKWMHTYALYCANPVYPMLINEFKTGIVNVGNAMLQGSERQSFIQLLIELNFLLASGQVKDLKNKIQWLFVFIERHWLGREEDEK